MNTDSFPIHNKSEGVYKRMADDAEKRFDTIKTIA